MTPLDKTLKRSLTIKGTDYVVTLSREALKLTRKGRRLGIELKWADLTSGASALAIALQASVGRFEDSPKPVAAAAKSAPRNRRAARRSSTKRSR